MKVRFWGTRGSIATPGLRTSKYGGNTSCTEVLTDDGTLIILDCGTGARELGLSLVKQQQPVKAHLLITHTHWDHIQGFPFFAPIFMPETELTIYAPHGFEQNLEQSMAGQMQYAYFPVKLEELRSRIKFADVEEGTFDIDGVTVETQYLNHTSPTIGYRITGRGVTLVYATDHEPFAPARGSLLHPGDQRHVEFLDRADLVIHDAQYSEDEYPSRLGWGHSTLDYATDVSMEAAAKRLALYHHDPTHDDATVQRFEAACQARAGARRSDIEIIAAAEGLELYLPESAMSAPRPQVRSALVGRPVIGARVLLATSNVGHAEQIGRLLRLDGVELTVATDPETAVQQARAIDLDMLILDASLFSRDVFEMAAEMSKSVKRMDIPVIVLSPRLDEETLRRGRAIGITDCLAIPFSPPMLHARVRTWLSRSLEPGRLGGRRSVRAGVSSVPRPVAAAPQRETTPAGRRDTQLERKTAMLAATPLFGMMDHEELQQLAQRAELRTVAAGAFALRQGEPGDDLFVIVEGRIRILGTGPDPRSGEVLLGELSPGEVFGEISLVDEQNHSASVLAVTKLRCLVIARQDFLMAMRDNSSLSFRMLQILTKRLREADKLLVRGGPDALTGLITRETLERSYRREAAAARRRHYDLGLLRVDIDNLSGVNQAYSHMTGDEAMQAMADVLRDATRDSDIVARDESDEFLVVLTDTTMDGLRLVESRIHRTLQEVVAHRGLPAAVTCTITSLYTSDPPANFVDLLEQLQQQTQQGRARPA